MLDDLHVYEYTTCRLSADPSKVRQQLWRAYASMSRTLRRLQRAEPMVQGSFYLQKRRCGKPTCTCTRGELHAAWAIARTEQGKNRTYMVPAQERARLRKLTDEYRRYMRARAVLGKRHQQLLALVDQLAENRLEVWPAVQRKADAE